MNEPNEDGWIYVDYWPDGDDDDLPPLEICLWPVEDGEVCSPRTRG